jgi:hypothetical protein
VTDAAALLADAVWVGAAPAVAVVVGGAPAKVNDPDAQSVGWVSTTVYSSSPGVVVDVVDVVVVVGVELGGSCQTARLGSVCKQVNAGSVVVNAVRVPTCLAPGPRRTSGAIAFPGWRTTCCVCQ